MSRISEHHLAARAYHWVIALLIVVSMGAIAAHLNDERDAPVAQEARK